MLRLSYYTVLDCCNRRTAAVVKKIRAEVVAAHERKVAEESPIPVVVGTTCEVPGGLF